MRSDNSILDRVRRVTAKTAGMLKAELQRIEDEKRRITADLDEAAEGLRQTLQQLGHSGGNGTAIRRTRVARGPALRARKGKRIRRSPAQLKQEAEAIIHFIKSKGTEGAKGPEIRARHAK